MSRAAIHLIETGRRHEFQRFRSRVGREDQYRIVQDGKEWEAAMRLTRFLRRLGADPAGPP